MRQLRELPDHEGAQQLCDALTSSGVEIELRERQGGAFAVWVVDEGQMAKAQQLADSWLDGGANAALVEAARKGRAARELTARIEERRMRQRQAVIERMAQLTRPRPTPLSWGLIGLCAAVYVAVLVLDWSKVAKLADMQAMLTIMDPRKLIAVTKWTVLGHELRWYALPYREPWRLITPILWHNDPLHILFNMFMLRNLGRVVEAQHGTRYLALFVLISGALSNVLNYEVAQAAVFGGMSGVVYGLLGLVWVRGKLDPRVGYRLSRATLQLGLIWLVFAFFSKQIANWCHVGGLLTGMAWAYVAAKLSQWRAR
jgi:membrane associated rhomboid family serine protease